ncbi:MAG: YbdK family carboxylate-amine ligase [Actinobacteria bacterium]|nr:YbdK family carboxylate-amine ligase [Actinomycetota bacterium]
MIEQTFGQSPALSLGVEEELMILDADTLGLTPAVHVLLRGAEQVELPGRLKTELFASVVELNTERCATAGEAAAAMCALRATATEIAGASGLRLAAAGAHPIDPAEEQEIVQEARYAEFVEYAGVSARRQGVNGLHVHVGMPSAEACLRVLEGVLPWLPVLLALSANSPHVDGRETGLLSNRAEILGQLPRSGAPPPFASYAEWQAFMDRVLGAGLPATTDYTSLWWDVRLHPRFGTLEIRMPDQPTSVRRSAAFVALVQALCATVLGEAPRRREPGDRAVYAQNRWAASRFGPRGLLIHPDEARAVSAAELADELLERIRPAARALGSEALLDALDPGRCEAERQLEVGRARGLRAVSADVVERSLASAG